MQLPKLGLNQLIIHSATIEPNVGVVAVPDKRLDVLEKMYNSKEGSCYN